MKKYLFIWLIIFIVQVFTYITLNHDLISLSTDINQSQEELNKISFEKQNLISLVAQKKSIKHLNADLASSEFVDIDKIETLENSRTNLAQR
jgi:hypothetical protein